MKLKRTCTIICRAVLAVTIYCTLFYWIKAGKEIRNSTSENKEQPTISKVVIWAYPRSGSTFFGELLTSSGPCFYVFEPLYIFRRHLTIQFEGGGTLEWLGPAMKSLLDCDVKEIARWGFPTFLFRSVPPPECHHQRLRLMKLVRGSLDSLLPWLKSQKDVKIIHLVRDPRGIRSSMEATAAAWSPATLNVSILCDRMRRDVKMREIIEHDRYMIIRYEDLVKNVRDVTATVFKFINVEYNEDVEKYLELHVEDSEYSEIKHSTYRGKNFNPESWKENLPQNLLKEIENNCYDLIKALNYTEINIY